VVLHLAGQLGGNLQVSCRRCNAANGEAGSHSGSQIAQPTSYDHGRVRSTDRVLA
jgi:hypothetical protein